MRNRRRLALALVLLAGSAWPLWGFTDGPLTNFMNLRGRTDENGYVRISVGTAGVTDGPLTAFGNLKARTDENGYLRVSCTGCGAFTVGTTTVTGGTIGNVFYHAAGDVIGEMTTSGSGTVVALKTGAQLTTPDIGVATGTSLNKVTITAPASSATLTLVTGSSLVTSGANSITLTSTGATNVTVPTSGNLMGSSGSWTDTDFACTSGTTGKAFVDCAVKPADFLTIASAPTTGSVLFAASSSTIGESNATFFWDNTNKRLGLGTAVPANTRLDISLNASTPDTIPVAASLRTVAADGAVNYNIFQAYGNNANNLFNRISGTAGSPTAVLSGEAMGTIGWTGYDGSNKYAGSAATIQGFAAENWSGSARGMRITFATVPAGSTTIAERLRITDLGNIKIAGTALRGTTEGTNHLDIFDGTAPVGTLANGISLYSASGELRVMDAAGNSTLLSPHALDTNEWVYDSVNTQTGKGLHVDMERLVKFLDAKFGTSFVREFEVK